MVETETKKELSETMSSRNDSSAEFSVRFSDSIRACHTAPLSNLDIMSMDEPEDEANGPLGDFFLHKNFSLKNLPDTLQFKCYVINYLKLTFQCIKLSIFLYFFSILNLNIINSLVMNNEYWQYSSSTFTFDREALKNKI